MSDKIKAVLALGHFDGVHIGHVQVLKTCIEKAKERNAVSVALTFDGDLKGFLNGKKHGVIDTVCERENKIKSLGVETICRLQVDEKTLSETKREFLEELSEKYDVAAYVCGKDFRFGKNAEGDAEFLKEYAKENGSEVFVVDDQNVSGEKVSTTAVKKLLESGDVKKAKILLGAPFSVTGKVTGGRTVGRSMGFPTANIAVDKSKTRLKEGVYFGTVRLERVYRAIINYGARPSFGLYDEVIEVHLIDFSGDLYGKTISVEFMERLRDVIKFESKEELKKQLVKDETCARKIKL